MSRSCDETYEVYDERLVRARKPHTCDACTETIPPGVFYTRIGTVFDGDVDSFKRCMRCQTIHEHLRTLGDGEMWPDERLNCGEEYRAHWGVEPPPEIAALAFLGPADVLPPLKPCSPGRGRPGLCYQYVNTWNDWRLSCWPLEPRKRPLFMTWPYLGGPTAACSTASAPPGKP